MAIYNLVVTSNALPGRDDEYNEWYDTVHLADVLALPGVTAGRRLEIAPISPSTPTTKYLAIYEIDIDDPAITLAELGARAKAGAMVVSDALERGTSEMWLYKVR